jgi:hypothetical protein
MQHQSPPMKFQRLSGGGKNTPVPPTPACPSTEKLKIQAAKCKWRMEDYLSLAIRHLFSSFLRFLI